MQRHSFCNFVDVFCCKELQGCYGEGSLCILLKSRLAQAVTLFTVNSKIPFQENTLLKTICVFQPLCHYEVQFFGALHNLCSYLEPWKRKCGTTYCVDACLGINAKQ
mmetsp:Transcript_7158/g.12797  ORF Transcript_7158/g.12797 Transcript_7158/m.12797 type:complete len:107 (+) Transcript_7158:204-524(+)